VITTPTKREWNAILKQLHNKLRHFFGQDLPVRDVPLHFSLPHNTGKEGAASGGATFYRDLNTSKNDATRQLRLIRTEMTSLNRRTLRPSSRQRLTLDMIALFYPLAIKQLTYYARLNSVPVHPEQVQIVDDVIAMTRIAIISYQILFSEYYNGSNFNYSRNRSVVLESASLIFELLRLKQRALAINYQLLPEQDWKTANTLFYVMSQFDDVDAVLPSTQRVDGMDGAKSLRAQFTLLHLIAKFDMLRWPSHLQLIIASYFHNSNHAVTVLTSDTQKLNGRDDLITYCYSTQAASVSSDQSPSDMTQIDKPLGEKIVLSCAALFTTIKKDCMTLIQAKHTNTSSAVPTRFSIFSQIDHLVIANQLLTGLDTTPAPLQLSKETTVDDLRIYVDFQNLFSLFRHRQGKFKSEQRLVDMLASRSAIFSDDDKATEKSLWNLLIKNEKMMRLSTHETNHTTSMSIGSLVAYGVGDDIKQPKLAVISRFFRPSTQVVEIDFQTIASYAEAVAITQNGADKQKSSITKPIPGLLVYDEKRPHEWGLIIAPQSILPGFDTFTLVRNDVELLVELKNGRIATPNFSYFTTTLTSAQLDFQGEPEYEKMTSTAMTRHAGAFSL